MNYSLTQEGQKYDFDRIRPQSTIQSRYLIFQKGKIEITTCNKRTAMTKINAVEDVGGLFLSISTGAQDEVWVLRLIKIIIQVVTVAFILNIQIMNAFLFLEEWNQVGQSGPALNNILMLLQNNSYFTYDLPLPFHNEKSIFLIVKLYNVGQS
ncbi:Hypothetical_protein [Hexamita inflata]|uniref:Hypothetical_protein n=1 Tax=Hexamita inflata TaxID=28002 RepID=A0AA86UDZ5_9EUKA|nr:Hypothetical protein HINF_LOCUS35881 [Hexamita inflata]